MGGGREGAKSYAGKKSWSSIIVQSCLEWVIMCAMQVPTEETVPCFVPWVAGSSASIQTYIWQKSSRSRDFDKIKNATVRRKEKLNLTPKYQEY